MKVYRLAIVATAITLSACNGKPMIAASEPVTENHLKSVSQWAQLASATADDFIRFAQKTGRPVYVAGDANSPFVAAFREMLSKELADRGAVISTHAANAAILNVSTRVVRMSDPQKPSIPPGVVEAAVAGAVEVTSGMVSYLVFAPNTEVIVTMTMNDDHHEWFRKNHIFYVDDAEARKYRALPSNVMTDRQPSPPPELRRVFTEGDRDE